MNKKSTIFTKIQEYILSFSILAMAGVLIGGVISRTVFNSSWTFTEEVGQALTTVVTFMGIGYCASQAKHISMSVVYDLVNEKYKKIFMIVISLFTSIIMFYIAYLSAYYTMGVYELGRVSPALQIPAWILAAPVPIGFLLGGIEYLKTFIKNITSKEIYISSTLKYGDNMENYNDTNDTNDTEEANT